MISRILCSYLNLASYLPCWVALTRCYYLAIFACYLLAYSSLSVCGSERKGSETSTKTRGFRGRTRESNRSHPFYPSSLALFNSFFAPIPVLHTRRLKYVPNDQNTLVFLHPTWPPRLCKPLLLFQ